MTSVSTPTYTTTSQTSFTKSLYIGLQDPEVTRLQNHLIKLGYLAPDAATGLYGRQTEAAVMKYQCAKNIVCGGTGASTGYGLVGNATRAKLNQEVATTVTTSGNTSTQLQALLQQLAMLQALLKQVRGY